MGGKNEENRSKMSPLHCASLQFPCPTASFRRGYDMTVLLSNHLPAPPYPRRRANSHALFCIGSPPIFGGVRGGKAEYSGGFIIFRTLAV